VIVRQVLVVDGPDKSEIAPWFDRLFRSVLAEDVGVDVVCDADTAYHRLGRKKHELVIIEHFVAPKPIETGPPKIVETRERIDPDFGKVIENVIVTPGITGRDVDEIIVAAHECLGRLTGASPGSTFVVTYHGKSELGQDRRLYETWPQVVGVLGALSEPEHFKAMAKIMLDTLGETALNGEPSY